jgi:NAD-dependent deacetylase
MVIDAELLQPIENAESVAVLTGAGISAESGISTFRGKDGLWSRFKPEELANVNAFLANPVMVWEWYQHRRDVLATARPNAGHYALAEWETLTPRFSLITQNVDGLHRLAGSKNVLELHGNIRINRCQQCGAESTDETLVFRGQVPTCVLCGGMLRPGVVWFGEYLPEKELQAAFRAAEQCDLLLTIGTSSQVYPAAALPEIARNAGAAVIEVNIEETPFTILATRHLRGEAGTILPMLVAAYRRTHSPQTESQALDP